MNLAIQHHDVAFAMSIYAREDPSLTTPVAVTPPALHVGIGSGEGYVW
jgi:hypothetical protein